MKIIKQNHFKKIYAGIRVNDQDELEFDWKKDDPDDVMYLYKDTSGQFDSDGIRYIYSYHMNQNVKGSKKQKVRDILKHINSSNELYKKYVEKFIEEGVLNFDDNYDLNSFDAIVYLEPTSKDFTMVDAMNGYFMEYTDCPWYKFGLIKKTYEDVEFDENKAFKTLVNECHYDEDKAKRELDFTLDKFNQLKSTHELFQIKRFIPKEIRSSFYDFLKFKDEEEREIYSLLQNADVLIFDDFMTSGSTVKEIARYLRSINDSNTLTVFVLVKQ